MPNRAADRSDALDPHDRVRASTSEKINERLDREMEERVREYAAKGQEAITRRIEELEREWDMERYLEMNASTLAFTGVMLGLVHNTKWLIVPSIVLPFLFQHATQGWCPPVPFLRKHGVRTRKEIDREKYALKALRGDFDAVTEKGGTKASRAMRVLEAVRI